MTEASQERFHGGVSRFSREYCVAGTPGCQFHEDLEIRATDHVIEMGRDPKAGLDVSPFDVLNHYSDKYVSYHLNGQC